MIIKAWACLGRIPWFSVVGDTRDFSKGQRQQKMGLFEIVKGGTWESTKNRKAIIIVLFKSLSRRTLVRRIRYVKMRNYDRKNTFKGHIIHK